MTLWVNETSSHFLKPQNNNLQGKLDQYFGSAKSMSVRQTRRGCFQELLGCEAADEFKWFNTTDGMNDQFATSLEESECFFRMCCSGCHEFKMVAKEEGTGEEILTMHRPWVSPRMVYFVHLSAMN